MWLVEKMDINYSLLPIKLFYLFYYGGVSCVTPFLPHYLKQDKGLTPVEVTTILGIVPFLVICTKPLVGHIADTTKCFRLLLGGVLIIGGLFMCLILIIPGIGSVASESTLKRLPSALILANSTALSNEPTDLYINVTNATLKYHDSYASYMISERTASPSPEPTAWTFWLVFGCVILGKAFGLSTAYPLMDALTLGVLGENSTKQYGRQRMWMAVGLAIALLTVSLFMDMIHTQGNNGRVDYRPAFVGFAMCICMSIVCVHFVPLPDKFNRNRNCDVTTCNQRHLEQDDRSEVSSTDSDATSDVECESGGLRKLLPSLRQPNVLLFLSMAFVCGMNFGTSVWMSPFYLKVDLVSSQTSIGVVVVFYCMCTIVSFMLSGHVITLVGHEVSLAICLLSYSVRALLWSAVTSPWQALPCEVLLGLSVGLWLPTMGSYAKNLAGVDCRASAQSVLSAVFDGFGVGVGNLVSGRLYEDLGGKSAWRLMSLTTGVAALVYIITIAYNTTNCHRNKPHKDIRPSDYRPTVIV